MFQLRIGSIDHKRFKGIFPRLSRNVRYNQTQSGPCWQEVKDVVDDNTIIEGRGWYFSSWIRLIYWNRSVYWWGSRQILSRYYEEAIEQRPHQAKGMVKQKLIGTTDATQARNQACCLRWNDKMSKIDVSLAHRRKLCSGKKDRVA